MKYLITSKWLSEYVEVVEFTEDSNTKPKVVLSIFPDGPDCFAEGVAAGLRLCGHSAKVIHDENS